MLRNNRRRQVIFWALAVAMVLVLYFGRNKEEEEVKPTIVEYEPREAYSGTGSAILSAPVPEVTPNPEDKVYSYFQGPKCWEEKRVWSGSWGNEYHDGANFGAFGCGFCCVANIYSTMTEYKCTPIEAYERAKKVTAYGGGGAISWTWLRETMVDMGLQVKLGEKPATYQEFRDEVAQNPATLVLVSSYHDDSYWKNTPGHYVTLFLFHPDTEEVFLTDSGDPEHNRHWVKLKKIYKALKTSSDFQYLSVTGYDETADHWKHKQAKGNWVKPESEETP